MVGPVPVRPLTVGHDFPADDAETPDIRRRCEFTEGNRLGSSPPDWNLTALNRITSVELAGESSRFFQETFKYSSAIKYNGIGVYNDLSSNVNSLFPNHVQEWRNTLEVKGKLSI